VDNFDFNAVADVVPGNIDNVFTHAVDGIGTVDVRRALFAADCEKLGCL
jgi:hypothetical protein